MPTITACLVDAFTQTPGLGNRAGVVLDASGLDAQQMQAIAKIVNVSETAFVFQTPAKDYDLEIRYFTPTREVPICGHATIATHWLRAQILGLAPMEILVKTGAGILPVSIDRSGDNVEITMTQGKATLDPPLDPIVCALIAQAFGIHETDFDPRLPLQIASTGHSKIMVPLLDKIVLNGLKPDMDALSQISEMVGCNGFFTFTLTTMREDIFLQGRMFAPAIGITEDPVTGNANGPCAYYLHTHSLLPLLPPLQREVTYSALQGEAMGKPGIIKIRLSGKNGHAEKVQIIGSAVSAGKMDFEVFPEIVRPLAIQNMNIPIL